MARTGPRSALATGAALALLLTACARPARPTIGGADLYAQVQQLQAAGEVELAAAPRGRLHVGTRHWLATTTSSPQVFSVRELIAGCQGGDPEQDVECTLALLREQRFTVLTAPPAAPRAPRSDDDDDDSGGGDGMLGGVPAVLAGVLVTGAIGAPLIYGLSVCEFPGCKVVFGLPLAFDATALLLILTAL